MAPLYNLLGILCTTSRTRNTLTPCVRISILPSSYTLAISVILTSVPNSPMLLFITEGIPKGFFSAKHSLINCLYLSSKTWRLSCSPGYTTISKGNMGTKFIIHTKHLQIHLQYSYNLLKTQKRNYYFFRSLRLVLNDQVQINYASENLRFLIYKKWF